MLNVTAPQGRRDKGGLVGSGKLLQRFGCGKDHAIFVCVIAEERAFVASILSLYFGLVIMQTLANFTRGNRNPEDGQIGLTGCISTGNCYGYYIHC